MIQLNLLPDVKLEYIKARRYRQLVTLIAGAVTVVSVLIMVLLLLNVKGLQAKHLSDLNKDIKTTTDKLHKNTNLNKVLTIQNQLNSLPTLDDQKPLASRLIGVGGSINTDLGTPTITLAKAVGTTGDTTYGYMVSAVNARGETVASAEATITDGNATLDKNNYNVIAWKAVPGATSYIVYGRTSSSELAMAKVQSNGMSLYSYNDQGADTPDGASPLTISILAEVTPKDASIGTLQVDFTADTINVKGTATTLYTVNQFADTLKYTKYSINGDTSNEQKAFSDVVLSDFGYNQNGSVFYTLTCSYNPDLFDIRKNINLDVPKNFITTRSQLDKPTVLFNGKTGSDQVTNQTTGQ